MCLTEIPGTALTIFSFSFTGPANDLLLVLVLELLFHQKWVKTLPVFKEHLRS